MRHHVSRPQADCCRTKSEKRAALRRVQEYLRNAAPATMLAAAIQ